MNARGLRLLLKGNIPVTERALASGSFRSHDLLQKGFCCVKNGLLPSHHFELPEKTNKQTKTKQNKQTKTFQFNQDKMNFSSTRGLQALFAPLKLQMEFKAVQQVQRLLFLPGSHLSLDIFRGNDETIGFEDVLNNPSQSELMGEPHLVGLLYSTTLRRDDRSAS
ncbi:LOW QUALITY PROTEIN: proteasome maturation protein-like [Meriones unguiculatus]|uniref:LOW QUALITY PROTEIN: proteasome maturation protein-like n=1 Tax=Meriones unguiculatus TaxID=10047 RepID=UPI000B4F01DE|nr:LOW QUALITY PROTEIN: proteasome maturation protein-like [Meriones unguiculatus]